jgi:hypothetical protein
VPCVPVCSRSSFQFGSSTTSSLSLSIVSMEGGDGRPQSAGSVRGHGRLKEYRTSKHSHGPAWPSCTDKRRQDLTRYTWANCPVESSPGVPALQRRSSWGRLGMSTGAMWGFITITSFITLQWATIADTCNDDSNVAAGECKSMPARSVVGPGNHWQRNSAFESGCFTIR